MYADVSRRIAQLDCKVVGLPISDVFAHSRRSLLVARILLEVGVRFQSKELKDPKEASQRR